MGGRVAPNDRRGGSQARGSLRGLDQPTPVTVGLTVTDMGCLDGWAAVPLGIPMRLRASVKTPRPGRSVSTDKHMSPYP